MVGPSGSSWLAAQMMDASTPGLPPMRAVWVVRERRSLAPRRTQDGGGEVGELGMGSVLPPREVLHADESRRSLRVVVQKGAKAVGAASAPVARVVERHPPVDVFSSIQEGKYSSTGCLESRSLPSEQPVPRRARSRRSARTSGWMRQICQPV